MYYLYSSIPGSSSADQEKTGEIITFTPRPFRWYLPQEPKEVKTTLVRFKFWLLTLGKAQIFAAIKEDKVVHTSYVVPKCFMFPFMKKGDHEIGPCYTTPEYRGQGIYPNVLLYILNNSNKTGGAYYIMCNSTNRPSIRGIEKAGFSFENKLIRTRFGRYTPLK